MKMHAATEKAKYRAIKTSGCGEPFFVDMTNDDAVEILRCRFGNRDLLISACHFTSADPSPPRIYPVRFHIISAGLERVRASALEVFYYINERFCIDPAGIDIILSNLGDIANHAADDGNHADNNNHQTSHIIGQGGSDHRDQDKDISSHCAGENDKTGKNGGNNRGLASTGPKGGSKGSNYIADGNTINNSSAGGSSKTTGTDITGTATAAEMMTAVPLVVHGSQPTPLLPVLNYQRARQMAEDGIDNLDLDVYQRDRFIRLPNSINAVTGRYVIPLSIKELLYLDGKAIDELARKPKAEDSEALPHSIPEAAAWFGEIHAEFDKKQRRQNKLRELILRDGWQIPPCTRRLLWGDFDKKTALEACRLIAQWYSFINAADNEIWYHVLRSARRNAVNDQQRLRAIVTFAVENRMFMGCDHPLLKRFCPAGRCFIAELIEAYERPYLFERA